MTFHIVSNSSQSSVKYSLQQNGWLLVSLIVLISAVILALVGITFFLTEHLRLTSLRQNQTKAIYLAQAGVMQAIYDFRFDTDGNGFVPGTYDAVPGDAGAPGIAGDDVYVLEGTQADFLLPNMIPSVLDQSNSFGLTNRDHLRLWRLRNARADASIRVDFLTVSWPSSPAGPVEGVARVEMAGSKVWPPGRVATSFAASGTRLDIANVSIGGGGQRTGNTIFFTSSGAESQMSNKAFIELKFEMSDGTIRIARYTPPPDLSTRSGSFTIKAVGEVNEGVFPFQVRRRIQAEYRLNQTDPTDIQAPGNIASDTGLVLLGSPVPPVSIADQRPGYREVN